MKFLHKTIGLTAIALMLVFGILVGTPQEAKAVKITIIIDIGGGHAGFQRCDGNGIICVIIEANAAAGATGGQPADAVLDGKELTVKFKPSDELLKLKKKDLKFQVEQETSLSDDLCKLLGVSEIMVKPGKYKIEAENGEASFTLRVKSK
jgi:hypothetical protein